MNSRTCLFVSLVTFSYAAFAQSYGYGQTASREAYAKSYRYEKAQNYTDAIKAVTIVTEKDYLYELRLGWLYYLSGNYANAKKHYQSAVAMAPSAIEPRLGMMLPLMAQSRYDEVETVAKQVLRVDPNNYIANLRLCISLRKSKKYENAIEVANRMLRLYPTDTSFLVEKGVSLSEKGDRSAARRPLNQVLTLDPENIVAKQQLKEL